MKKRILALSVLASITSFVSQAQDSSSVFSYDTVSLGYKTLSIDGIDGNFKGLSLKASKSFGDSGVFVFGEYSAVEYSDSVTQGDVKAEIESDVKQYELGLGYQYSISDKSDLFAELAFGNSEITSEEKFTDNSDHNFNFVSELKADDDFYRFGVGGRSQIYDQFEVFAKVDAIKYSEGNSTEIGWTVGGRYNITQHFDAQVSVFNYENLTNWFVGGVYRF
ncbi:hypothetical protein D5R81_00090 [Parashewanella spongiae]|uniref:Outer membrane protein beta-barrel domain-containing protein n=1 Tax=Parashewanella spongiae TaxID=342950 RepID=A0A3A6UK05_9GAMM|nr:hypothetical protein [Parashewanella spongiae]MCL1076584.1 porin family protein [Parashewanella spongiae]RJY19542.1 hypothetical protein D5R81_00090 [Parashewanella spongiae]